MPCQAVRASSIWKCNATICPEKCFPWIVWVVFDPGEEAEQADLGQRGGWIGIDVETTRDVPRMHKKHVTTRGSESRTVRQPAYIVNLCRCPNAQVSMTSSLS